jgi:hypothetical protein
VVTTSTTRAAMIRYRRRRCPAAPRPPRAVLLLLAAGAALAACGERDPLPRSDRVAELLAPGVDAGELHARLARFPALDVAYADAGVGDAERQALAHLADAAGALHEAYLLQVAPRNLAWRERLAQAEGAGQAAALAYFDHMGGPWDRSRGHEPFLAVGERPPGAGFYPRDYDFARLSRWVREHPEDRETFVSALHVVRREHGTMHAVPFRAVYADQLERAAGAVRAAAAAARAADPQLAAHLDARAQALLADDPGAADEGWLDLAARIEVVLGPYDFADDRLAGYRATYVAVVALADPEAQARFEALRRALAGLAPRLAEGDDEAAARLAGAPVRIADAVLLAGAAAVLDPVVALALPRDERLRDARGKKALVLANSARARHATVLRPIEERALAGDAGAAGEAADAWLVFLGVRELTRALGPGQIAPAGRARTTARTALRERHAALDDARAEAAALHALVLLAAEGALPEATARAGARAHLADLLARARLGAAEPAAAAALVQLRHLFGAGALRAVADGRLELDLLAVAGAARDLAADAAAVKHAGDYDAAGRLLHGAAGAGDVLPEPLARLVARLDAEGVPLGVRPRFVPAR